MLQPGGLWLVLFTSLFLYAVVVAGFCVLGTLIIKAKKKKRNTVATEGVKSVKVLRYQAVSQASTPKTQFFGQQTIEASAYLRLSDNQVIIEKSTALLCLAI